MTRQFLVLPVALLLAGVAVSAHAQGVELATSALPDAPLPTKVSYDPQASSSQTPAPPAPATQDQTQKSEDQVKKEEKQRIMGVVPNFNVSYSADVPPLTPSQKMRLAFRSAIDPFQFLAAGLDAGYSMETDSFGPQYTTVTNSAGKKVTTRQEGYGQGVEGFAKYFGASYADNFDGTIIGNALLPILLKEDPRYFRKGTGTVTRRILYSISTTVWCKRDNGTWGPNYANVIGNLAAGGISNLYYPSFDRGAGLTFNRGFQVTAEGTIGALTNEFLPDLTKHFLHRDVSGQKVDVTSGQTPTPAPTTPPVLAPPAPPPQP
jgi:hypothetical protein